MYSQVLVPLDGSEASEQALPHAQSLAGAFGARVHLLQIISLSRLFTRVSKRYIPEIAMIQAY
jgi:nucleotide-binding universal stress UspA family protein